MRWNATILALTLSATMVALGQEQTSAPQVPAAKSSSGKIVIPSGAKVPVTLKHAISTKSAKVGDAVYAQTSFPYVVNDQILIPAGTYIQGRISQIQRPGRVKGRAELLIHFTTMIYPSGYTVMLPGAVDNVPGAESTNMKGEEGTIQQRGQKGKDIGTAAQTTATGTLIGAAAGGGKGAGIGAAAGGVTGLAIALLTRGNDVRMEAGTTLEMVIQRQIEVDPVRIATK